MKKIFLLLAIAFASQLRGGNNELAPLKEGDVVCFIGNSITQDGRYHMLFHHYFATRYPGVKVEFYSCGISGDVAEGMLHRMEKDILALKPDYAFLMTGMNDMQRYLYDEGVVVDSTMIAKRENTNRTYEKLTRRIGVELTNIGTEIIFLTPSIYDETSKIAQANSPGANGALKLYGEHIKALAAEYKTPVVDFNTTMDSINRLGQETDSSFTIIGHDRIHPGDVGHFIMNYLMVSTLYSDSKVSSVVINAKKKRVDEAYKVDVEILKAKNLSFTVKAESLPFAVTPRFEDALDWVNFQDDCNEELLTVTSLRHGDYELFIDDKSVGVYCSCELKEGVNLAFNNATPQYQQAEKVFYLCEKYHKTMANLRDIALIEYKNLRQYEGDNTLASKKAYLDTQAETQRGKSWYEYQLKVIKNYVDVKPNESKYWVELDEIRDEIYTVNQPQERTYKLVKQ